MIKNYHTASLTIGFLVWLLATITFRIAGQYFFLVDNPLIFIALYIGVIPLLAGVALLVINLYRLENLQPTLSAALLVLPGMVLDTFVILFFKQLMPNMPSHADAPFGSWLIWAYSIVLIVGVIKSR